MHYEKWELYIGKKERERGADLFFCSNEMLFSFVKIFFLCALCPTWLGSSWVHYPKTAFLYTGNVVCVFTSTLSPYKIYGFNAKLEVQCMGVVSFFFYLFGFLCTHTFSYFRYTAFRRSSSFYSPQGIIYIFKNVWMCVCVWQKLIWIIPLDLEYFENFQ